METRNTRWAGVGEKSFLNLMTEGRLIPPEAGTRALAPRIDDSTELSSIWFKSHSEASIPTICMTTQHTIKPTITMNDIPFILNCGIGSLRHTDVRSNTTEKHIHLRCNERTPS